MENDKSQGNVQEFHLSEWETTARHRGEKQVRTSQNSNVKQRIFLLFDRVIPAYRGYFGFSRKTACIAILVALFISLALIFGLAIGLSRKSRYASAPAYNLDTAHLMLYALLSHHQNLPLGSQTYTGDLTYYGPGLGACGITSSDTDHIVSISHFTFDAVSKGSNPNANPLCGHKLRAVRNGSSIDLTVVDRCMAFPDLTFTKVNS